MWRVTVAEFWWDETPLSRVNVKVSSAVAAGREKRRAIEDKTVLVRERMVSWILGLCKICK